MRVNDTARVKPVDPPVKPVDPPAAPRVNQMHQGVAEAQRNQDVPLPQPSDTPSPVGTSKPDSTIVNPNGIPYKTILQQANPDLPTFKVHDDHVDYAGHCDRYSEFSVLGHGGVYDTAKDWQNYARQQKHLYTTAPPAGVPVFYNTSNPARHVTISAGGGYVWTTGNSGERIKKVRYDQVYGGAPYAGWSDVVQGSKGAKEPTYIQYDTKTVGSAPKIDVPPGSAGSSADTTKPPAPVVTPTPTAGVAATTDTALISSGSSQSSGSSGSWWESLFGSQSPQRQAVAAPVMPSMSPISTQFMDSSPSTNQSTSSGSSADTLESTDPNADVTVKPVGS
jgi:hypothetical protein